MTDLKLGVALWSQASDWPAFLAAAQAAERLGYDHVWTWDHLQAIFGDPDQPIFEGYTALAAVAQATERVRIGLFVGANPFRNPGLAVKSVTTIDHISGGRAIMGLGAAWFGHEHQSFGIDFGRGFGERLDWLAEATADARILLDGGEVTSKAGGRYAFDHLRVLPPPVQAHLPMMIGGGGERKTLRIVARVRRHVERLRHARDAGPQGRHPPPALRGRRPRSGRDRALGRLQDHDPGDRGRGRTGPTARCWSTTGRRSNASSGDHTFWTGTPEQIAETMIGYRRIGFHTFIVELPAPYDAETMETLIHGRQADGRERPGPELTSTRRTSGPVLLPGRGYRRLRCGP